MGKVKLPSFLYRDKQDGKIRVGEHMCMDVTQEFEKWYNKIVNNNQKKSKKWNKN